MTVAAYRDRVTGYYPITLVQLRASAGALFGDEPTPDVLDLANADPVMVTEPPPYDPATQALAEGPPETDGIVWFQGWEVTDLPPVPIVVYPADLWRRASEAEAEAIESAMAAQSAKFRNLFRAASTYRSDDQLWPMLMGAATQLFGETRAAELLAAS